MQGGVTFRGPGNEVVGDCDRMLLEKGREVSPSFLAPGSRTGVLKETGMILLCYRLLYTL